MTTHEELIPVVVPVAGVAALDVLCVERKMTVAGLMRLLGLRVAAAGCLDAHGKCVGGPDDGAMGLEQDEVLLLLAHLQVQRGVMPREVLGVWRAMDMEGQMRPWLTGVTGLHGVKVEAAAAVVAYMGDLALGRDLVQVLRGKTQEEVDMVLRDSGLSGAEWQLLRFEHGLPESAVALKVACEGERAGANPFTGAVAGAGGGA